MTRDPSGSPGSPTHQPAAHRQARSAAALRANLARRKQQARARDGAGDTAPDATRETGAGGDGSAAPGDGRGGARPWA